MQLIDHEPQQLQEAAVMAALEQLEASDEQRGLAVRRSRRRLQRRPGLRRLLASRVAAEFQQEVDAGNVTIHQELHGEDAPFIALIKWILENPETIAKFISMIISLFPSD